MGSASPYLPPESRAADPSVAPAPHRPQRRAMGHVLWLMQSRPMLFWGGLWLSLCVVSVLSLSSLLSPSFSSQHPPTDATIEKPENKTQFESPAEQPAASASEGSKAGAEVAPSPTNTTPGTLPLWFYGAILLSCGGSALIIARLVGRSPRPRRLAKKRPASSLPQLMATAAGPAPTPTPRSPGARSALPPQLHGNTATLQWQAATTAGPSPSLPFQNRQSGPRSVPAPPQRSSVPVSVVPEHESHPLDWPTASLADTVDLRKRRSVSSWL